MLGGGRHISQQTRSSRVETMCLFRLVDPALNIVWGYYAVAVHVRVIRSHSSTQETFSPHQKFTEP